MTTARPYVPEVTVAKYRRTLRRIEEWGIFFWSLGFSFWNWVQWRMILTNYDLTKIVGIPPLKKASRSKALLSAVVSKDTDIGFWGAVWGYGEARFGTAAEDVGTDTADDTDGEQLPKKKNRLVRALGFCFFGWRRFRRRDYVAGLEDMIHRAEIMANNGNMSVHPVALRHLRNWLATFLFGMLSPFPLYLIWAVATGGPLRLGQMAFFVFIIAPAIIWIVQPGHKARNAS